MVIAIVRFGSQLTGISSFNYSSNHFVQGDEEGGGGGQGSNNSHIVLKLSLCKDVLFPIAFSLVNAN